MSLPRVKKLFPLSVSFAGISASQSNESFTQKSIFSNEEITELLHSAVKWPFIASQLTGWLPLGKESDPQAHKLNLWRRLFYTPSTASLLSFPSICLFVFLLISLCLGIGFLLSPHLFQTLSSQQDTTSLYFTLDITSAVLLIIFHVGLRVLLVRSKPKFADFWASLHLLLQNSLGYLETSASKSSRKVLLRAFLSETSKKFRKVIGGHAGIAIYILTMDGYIGISSATQSVESERNNRLLFSVSQLIGCFVWTSGFFSLLIMELLLDVIAFCFNITLTILKEENDTKQRSSLGSSVEKFGNKIDMDRITIQRSIEQYEHLEKALEKLHDLINSRVILEVAFIVIQTANRARILLDTTRNIGMNDPSAIVLGNCGGIILLLTQWGSLYRMMNATSSISTNSECILSQILRKNIQQALSNWYDDSILRVHFVSTPWNTTINR